MTEKELTKGKRTDALMEVRETIDEARQDTTPFAVVKDNQVSVIGDANKLQTKKNDYTVRFRFPKSMLKELGLEKVSAEDITFDGWDFIVVDVEYKDVFIASQRRIEAVSNLSKIMPFYFKVSETGEVSQYPPKEQFEVLATLEREVISAMYNLVAWVLGIREDWEEFIMFESVTENIKQLIESNPDLLNETEFFG